MANKIDIATRTYLDFSNLIYFDDREKVSEPLDRADAACRAVVQRHVATQVPTRGAQYTDNLTPQELILEAKAYGCLIPKTVMGRVFKGEKRAAIKAAAEEALKWLSNSSRTTEPTKSAEPTPRQERSPLNSPTKAAVDTFSPLPIDSMDTYKTSWF